MRVLDLFSGMKGWSAPFAERGHETLTVEIEPKFEPDWQVDILTISARDVVRRLGGSPDIILASPPCTSFTTMTMGRNWTMDDRPKTVAAAIGYALVLQTRRLIADLDPRWYVIENPRARLRSLRILDDEPQHETVWYCHVGEDRAKPTDLWGRFPPSLKLPAACHNQRPEHPPECCCRDHIAAVRGSRGGTQGGVSSAEAGKIPYELAKSVCIAAEIDMGVS